MGFHGCTKTTYEKVLNQLEVLKPSDNSYDWLGHGTYFWENNYERAKEWSISKYGDEGRVLGAIIDLGYCLNLTDYGSTEILREAYRFLEFEINISGKRMPENKKGRSENDVLLRDLDCAVIQEVHVLNEKANRDSYDSVRGVFTEGKVIYPGSALVEKTHIQICVVNPNCIKGYFAPIDLNSSYRIP